MDFHGNAFSKLGIDYSLFDVIYNDISTEPFYEAFHRYIYATT